ncbi:MAG: hypothetical protein HQ581_18610 [Planctomycetes bacterium]|nr:hypothetical protein [Planctomycetota bacterium]
MATFKILKSRNYNDKLGKIRSEFVVELLDGEIEPGDRFRLYETHHYTDYTVYSVESPDKSCVVYAEPDLWYEGWHEGSILDTNDLESGRKYGYGGAGKLLYHPDALKALDNEEDE